MRKSPLNVAERLSLRDVPGKGKGVFARRAFAPGDKVLEFVGDRVDVATLSDLTHALQVGPREFLTKSGDIDDFVNHSCAPNTGINDGDGHVVLFALKDIAAGDEITFDYATTQAGGFSEMSCGCGASGCRGRIADFIDMPASRQHYYLAADAVLGYLKIDGRSTHT